MRVKGAPRPPSRSQNSDVVFFGPSNIAKATVSNQGPPKFPGPFGRPGPLSLGTDPKIGRSGPPMVEGGCLTIGNGPAGHSLGASQREQPGWGGGRNVTLLDCTFSTPVPIRASGGLGPKGSGRGRIAPQLLTRIVGAGGPKCFGWASFRTTRTGPPCRWSKISAPLGKPRGPGPQPLRERIASNQPFAAHRGTHRSQGRARLGDRPRIIDHDRPRPPSRPGPNSFWSRPRREARPPGPAPGDQGGPPLPSSSPMVVLLPKAPVVFIPSVRQWAVLCVTAHGTNNILIAPPLTSSPQHRSLAAS